MLSVAYTKRQHAVHPLEKVETMGPLKRKARNPDGRLTVSPNACLGGILLLARHPGRIARDGIVDDIPVVLLSAVVVDAE